MPPSDFAPLRVALEVLRPHAELWGLAAEIAFLIGDWYANPNSNPNSDLDPDPDPDPEHRP